MNNSGLQWKRIHQGAATTVISDAPCVISRMSIFAPLAGTVGFYDCAATAGTSATNELGIFGTALYQTIQNQQLDYQMRNGCVVVTSGTVDFLLGIR